MEIRTLRPGEREALLELLDGWELADGWRGRDFFRRYVEQDPTYEDDNVFVAAEGGRLAACVQVFPRPLRVAGTAVATGGIGSVFTHPESRKRGLGEALLARAAEAMRARGLALSLLFAAPHEWPWYGRLGWKRWDARGGLFIRRAANEKPAPPGLAIAGFARARDLADVRALHARFCDLLPGTIVRGDALWQASLHNAGNPREEFLVARANGELVAYARATVLYGVLSLMELACAPGFEPALAALVACHMEPRAADPWERADRASEALRGVAVTAALRLLPDLVAALGQVGIETRDVADMGAMLRVLDVDALAARVGERPRAGEAPDDFLARLLPPEELVYWPADRF